jgi:hypothetical protein
MCWTCQLIFGSFFISTQNNMIYQGDDLKLAEGKQVWTERWHGPELVQYLKRTMGYGFMFKTLPDEGEDSLIRCKRSPDGSEFTVADTREELLLHAIEQQKQIIEKAQAEIDRLEGMREVPLVEQSWTPQQTWIGGEGGDH